jgi:hypothetical protein
MSSSNIPHPTKAPCFKYQHKHQKAKEETKKREKGETQRTRERRDKRGWLDKIRVKEKGRRERERAEPKKFENKWIKARRDCTTFKKRVFRFALLFLSSTLWGAFCLKGSQEERRTTHTLAYTRTHKEIKHKSE